MNTDSTITNWVEVADKALNMGQSAIVTMTEAIKGIAPEVWEILVRQVYVEAVADVLGWAAVAAFGMFGLYLTRKAEIVWKWDDFALFWLYLITIAISATGVIAFISSTCWGFKAIMNPEYYAIQKFMVIASGAGL